MKLLLIYFNLSAAILGLPQKAILNTNFAWYHCENWRILTFSKNGRYELTESWLGAAPHTVKGQYEVTESKIHLTPKSCKIDLKIKTKSDAEYAKERGPELCRRRLGPSNCTLTYVTGKEYKTELVCTELAKTPDADSTELQTVIFGNHVRRWDDLSDCIYPVPQNK